MLLYVAWKKASLYPFAKHTTVKRRGKNDAVKFPWLISQPNGNEVKLSDEQAIIIAKYILTVEGNRLREAAAGRF